MNKIKEIFINLGYTETEYNELINAYNLKEYDHEQESKLETLLEKLRYNKKESEIIMTAYYGHEKAKYYKILKLYFYFLHIGYKKEEIIKMTVKIPNITNLNISNIQNKINNLENLGYKKEEIITMTIIQPTLLGLTTDLINEKINYFITMGFKKEEIITMTAKRSQVLTISLNKIKKINNYLISIGYSKSNVLKIAKSHFSIYSLNINNIRQKINDLMNLNYLLEDVRKMTTELPALFSLNIENIKEKIEFYDSIGLREISVTKPKYLMQSVKVSFARYAFYEEKGIKITTSNYLLLFEREKEFQRKNQVTKSQILDQYNYEEYQREKKNERNLQLKLK